MENVIYFYVFMLYIIMKYIVNETTNTFDLFIKRIILMFNCLFFFLHFIQTPDSWKCKFSIQVFCDKTKYRKSIADINHRNL